MSSINSTPAHLVSNTKYQELLQTMECGNPIIYVRARIVATRRYNPTRRETSLFTLFSSFVTGRTSVDSLFTRMVQNVKVKLPKKSKKAPMHDYYYKVQVDSFQYVGESINK